MIEQVKRHQDTKSQSGFVAIFSVMIIMAVLTLISVGFAALTQRAQRRTLDNQLSTQAYYAAESGVNDATTYLEDHPLYLKSDCRSDSGIFNYTLDSTLSVEYTCLLITRPSDLKYSNTDSAIGLIQAEDGSPFTSLTFSWDDPGRTALPPSTTGSVLPSESGWGNNIGGMRIDLVPAGDLSRAAMVNSSYTFFLYPTSESTAATSFTASPAMANKGQMFTTRCNSNSGYRCVASVTLETPGTVFVMRMTKLYNSIDLKIEPFFNGISKTLVNGQVDVDVTGKANDVFRRVQVRVPVSGVGSNDWGLRDAFGLLTTDSICKRYFVGPGFPAESVSPGIVADSSLPGVCAVQ